MFEFLSTWKSVVGLGKRKPGEEEDDTEQQEQPPEVSPAKRARFANHQQQAAGSMQHARQRSNKQPGADEQHGRHPAAEAGDTLSLPKAPQQQQQLPAGLSQARVAATTSRQQQHHQQQQQQQHQEPRSSTLDISGYQQVLQKLEQPPAGTAAHVRHRAAVAAAQQPQHARPAAAKHMPLPPPPPAAAAAGRGFAQDLMHGLNITSQHHRGPPQPFFRLSSTLGSSSSPPTWRLTPTAAAGGGGPLGSSRRQQRAGYAAWGPPPPPQQYLQQQANLPDPSTAAAGAAGARGRFAGDIRRTGRPYGSSVAAAAAGGGVGDRPVQHTAMLAAAPAAAAAGGGRSSLGGVSSRGMSPPLQEVRQRLSYGGAAAEHYARPYAPATAAAAAAANGPADTAAAGGGGGVPLQRTPPPASFAAELEAVGAVDLLGMPAVLSSREAALIKRVQEAEAKYNKQLEMGKQARHRTQLLTQDIDRTVYGHSPDYQPNRTDKVATAALQQLAAEGMVREQQRLQHEAQLQQERQQQLQRRQQVLAAAATPITPVNNLQQQHQQQEAEQPSEQLQQQQQDGTGAAAAAAAAVVVVVDEDDDDDVVVVVSSDDEEDEQQQQQQQQQQLAYDDEAEGVGVGGSEVSDEEEEDEEDGANEDEGSESSEAEEAAEGIHALGISPYMGRHANWRTTPEQMNRFKQATSGAGPSTQVLASHERSALELTCADLATLSPGQWLNDECMNMYMALLQDRDTAQRSNGGLCCHFFNTFFLNSLYKDAGQYDYKKVRRWTLPARLKAAGQASDCVLKCDRVLIPVHEGIHWTALMVDIKQQRLVQFDSMLGRNTAAVEAVRRWVADEAQDKLKATWDTSSWEAVYPQDIPRQQNGYDCGVFALMFCNRMAMKGGFFDFLQSDISVNIRAAITCDLLDGAIKATGSKQP